ncbi:MAG: hypothetical protein IPH27_10530 [Actinomycetales bacterium]|nr:hypothetical protein [Candidatus Phosphoribacter baldrii]
MIPDHLVVDAATGTWVREQVADKQVMTVRDEQGVSLVPVPQDLRREPVLSTEQVSTLVEIARAIQAHTGRPSDVEWVSHEGRILVTQARAITSLPPDLMGMEWSRQMLIERYPDPITPLTWSAVSSTFFASLATTMRSLGGELPTDVPMIRLIHGRAYVNVTAFQQGMQSLPLRPPVAAADEGEVGAEAEMGAEADAVGSARGAGAAARPRPNPAMASAALGLVRLVLGTHRDWERRLPDYVERITTGASTRWEERSTADLLAARHTAAGALIPMLDNHARAIVAADLTLQLLGGITRRWLGDEDQSLVLALLSGLTGNLTVETNRALWQLAQLDPSSAEFEAGLVDFLGRYGHRSPRYEFSHPTWREDPSQVRELIALVAAGSPDPAIGETKRRADRELATAQARGTVAAGQADGIRPGVVVGADLLPAAREPAVLPRPRRPGDARDPAGVGPPIRRPGVAPGRVGRVLVGEHRGRRVGCPTRGRGAQRASRPRSPPPPPPPTPTPRPTRCAWSRSGARNLTCTGAPPRRCTSGGILRPSPWGMAG